MFAGRNISASHLAMSSTRVMATCSLMGQAAGAAAALAVEKTCDPRGVYLCHMAELQRRLMEDGCYLPGLVRKPAPTQIDLPSEQLALLQNGWERPHAGVENRHPAARWHAADHHPARPCAPSGAAAGAGC